MSKLKWHDIVLIVGAIISAVFSIVGPSEWAKHVLKTRVPLWSLLSAVFLSAWLARLLTPPPPPSPPNYRPDCKRYGISILDCTPVSDPGKPNQYKVTGRCAAPPPSGIVVWLMVANDNLTKFWPARQIGFDTNHDWTATVGLGPGVPGKPSEEMKMIVALVGDSGQIACNYYLATVDQWSPQKKRALPRLPDLVPCDMKTVIKTN